MSSTGKELDKVRKYGKKSGKYAPWYCRESYILSND